MPKTANDTQPRSFVLFALHEIGSVIANHEWAVAMLPDVRSMLAKTKTLFLFFQLFRILNEAWSNFSSPHLVNCTTAHALRSRTVKNLISVKLHTGQGSIEQVDGKFPIKTIQKLLLKKYSSFNEIWVNSEFYAFVGVLLLLRSH